MHELFHQKPLHSVIGKSKRAELKGLARSRGGTFRIRETRVYHQKRKEEGKTEMLEDRSVSQHEYVCS